MEVPTANPWRRCSSPAHLLPLSPYAPRPSVPITSRPDCLQRCPSSVRVVRQGVPRRAQRNGHRRAQQMRRDDVTRWQPTLDVGEGLDPSRGSPQGAPLHCRRRTPGGPPGRASTRQRSQMNGPNGRQGLRRMVQPSDWICCASASAWLASRGRPVRFRMSASRK